MGALAVVAGLVLLLLPAGQEPPPTEARPTVSPNPVLLTRAPLCQEAIGLGLADRGWASGVTLDWQRARLEIRLDDAAAGDGKQVPAAPIWGAFEAALAAGKQGCSGYAELVVEVGDFRAQVAAEDIFAWGAGEIDDVTLSDRVDLTKQG
jgi:hypothetical protein